MAIDARHVWSIQTFLKEQDIKASLQSVSVDETGHTVLRITAPNTQETNDALCLCSPLATIEWKKNLIDNAEEVEVVLPVESEVWSHCLVSGRKHRFSTILSTFCMFALVCGVGGILAHMELKEEL